MRDRGYVFVDDQPSGVLSRSEQIFSLPLQVLPGQKVSIVVENQGRICYGSNLADMKGIVGNVSLGEKVVRGWEMTGVPLDGAMLTKYCAKVQRTTASNLKMKQLLR